MKRFALAAVLMTLAAPAPAAETIADQAQSAFDLFAGGLSRPDFALGRYTNEVFRNIAGKWISLDGPQPGTGVETYGADTERLCTSRAALTLASPDPFSLRMTGTPMAAEFVQTYTLVAGSTYAERTDGLGYLEAIGLGLDKRGPQFDQQRAAALALANGTVQLFRPSNDILVVVRHNLYPSVLARCPSP